MLAGLDAVDVVDADRGRIAVLRPDGMFVLLTQRGKRLDTFHLGRKGVTAVRLTGPILVVLKNRTIEVRNATTGAPSHRWSRQGAGPVEALDADGDLAVYSSGTALHLLRLSSGRDRVISIPTRDGPVFAELETEGLFHAYNKGDEGRVVFVPRRQLTAGLR